MYSDMSIRTIARSSSNRNSASARASSVLPTPVGTEEEERSDRTVRVAETGAVAPDGVGDGLHRPFLSDHPLMQMRLEVDELLHLALHQPRHGNARPPGDDLRDVLLGDLLRQHATFGMQLLQLLLGSESAGLEGGQPPVAQLRRGGQVAVAFGSLRLGPDLLDLLLGGLNRGDRLLLEMPASRQCFDLLPEVGQFLAQGGQPLLGGRVRLLGEGGLLDLQLDLTAAALVDLLRHRVDLDSQPGCGFVDQVDRLVRQLPGRDVTVGENRGGQQRAVGDADAVMDFVALLQTAQDGHGIGHRGLGDEHRLEPPLERGVLFDVLAELVEGGGTDHAQLAAGEHGLEHVGRVHRPFGGARSDHRVQLVDESDDLALGIGDLGEDRLEPLLELAAVLGPGHHRPEVQRHDALALEPVGNVAVGDPPGEAFDHGRLADAGLPDQDRVVLGSPAEDLDDAADLLVAADDRVELALAGGFGQVPAVLLERVERRLGIVRPHTLRTADLFEGGQESGQFHASVCQEVGGGPGVDERQHQVFDGDEVVLHLPSAAVREVEHPGEICVEAGLGSSVGARQAVEFGCDRGTKLRDGCSRCLHQRQGDPIALIQQGAEQMQRCDCRMVALGGALGGGEQCRPTLLRQPLEIHSRSILPDSDSVNLSLRISDLFPAPVGRSRRSRQGRSTAAAMRRSSTTSSGSASGSAAAGSFIRLYALTTKNITRPTMRKLMSAWMNAPIEPTWSPVSGSTGPNVHIASSPDRSNTMAISGLMIRVVNASMTVANATPSTNATAMSTRLPRLMNSLNSLIMGLLSLWSAAPFRKIPP
jgi:hypothetical protein